MSKFIKLSTIIINTHHIKLISISPTEYNIHFMDNHISGLLVFGIGSVDSNYSNINICIKEHPEDYKIISDWIKNTP